MRSSLAGEAYAADDASDRGGLANQTFSEMVFGCEADRVAKGAREIFRLAFGVRCFGDLGFGSWRAFCCRMVFLRVKLLIRRAVQWWRTGNVLEAHLLQSYNPESSKARFTQNTKRRRAARYLLGHMFTRCRMLWQTSCSKTSARSSCVSITLSEIAYAEKKQHVPL